MLQEQLNSQPGLRIDITETMAQLGARFQQASDDMKEASGGEPDSNMWEVSAKGLVMTKAKLERFAEFVAQGGKLDDGPDQVSGRGNGNGNGKGENNGGGDGGKDAACLRPANGNGEGTTRPAGAGAVGEQREGRSTTSGFPYQEGGGGGGGATGSGGGGGGVGSAGAGTAGSGGVEAASRRTSATASGPGERYAQPQTGLTRGGETSMGTSSGGNTTTATQSQQQSQPWMTGQSQGQQSMGAPPIPQHQQQQQQQQHQQPHSFQGPYAMNGAHLQQSLGAGVNHGGDAGGYSSVAAMAGIAGGGAAGGGQCNDLLATGFMDQLAPWLWYYGVDDWPGTAGPGGV